MKKVSIILGNGFDLNLMLRTSYSDFARSREFKNLTKILSLVDISNPEQSLYAHLQSVFDKQNWFDIEEEIYDYASKCKHNNYLLPLEFNHIKDALKQYLIRVVENTTPCHESLAYKFMKNVIEESNSDICVFNFNYTNCLTLCDCNSRDNVNCCNIHGDLASEIVLGYYDYIKKIFYNKLAKFKFNYFANSPNNNFLFLFVNILFVVSKSNPTILQSSATYVLFLGLHCIVNNNFLTSASSEL